MTDAPGNPTSFKGAAHTFNANNQQTDSGIGYDGAGNPTTYHSQAITYDPENRMTAYGSVQTDGYDGDALRTWKVVSGVSTYFLYDGTQIVGIYGVSGSAPVFEGTNTWGAGGLVSRRYQGVTDFYVFDERGNVSQRTSSTGAVSSTDAYDAYGARTGTAPLPDPRGFAAQAGYYSDAETGLVLCTHRFYDPGVGRWLTRDPISYQGGVNVYGYCQNNSINCLDPTGYFSWHKFIICVEGQIPEGARKGLEDCIGSITTYIRCGQECLPLVITGQLVPIAWCLAACITKECLVDEGIELFFIVATCLKQQLLPNHLCDDEMMEEL